MRHLVVSNRQINHAAFVPNPEALDEILTGQDYDTLIFAFWSWRVPNRLLHKYKCYGMHVGFLLEGKGAGGSPIDNLQALDVKWAALNVFEMNEVIDGGKVVLAIPIQIKKDKQEVIRRIDDQISDIVFYLTQPKEHIPERFKRLSNAK